MLARSGRRLARLQYDTSLPCRLHSPRLASTRPRVLSKNLFPLQPTGVLDPDVAKVDAALKQAIMAAQERGEDPTVELPPEEYAAHLRRSLP
jgi:hypothetical protein